MTHNVQSGHPERSMTACDIVTAASKYGTDNPAAFIDRNRIQPEARTEDIMPLEPLRTKWDAFNGPVLNIDGHDSPHTPAAIEEAHRTRGRPTVIIARTVKGK